MRKRIDVILTEEELSFLGWLAERDNTSIHDEMLSLFRLQLWEEQELYMTEYKAEREAEK